MQPLFQRTDLKRQSSDRLPHRPAPPVPVPGHKPVRRSLRRVPARSSSSPGKCCIIRESRDHYYNGLWQHLLIIEREKIWKPMLLSLLTSLYPSTTGILLVECCYRHAVWQTQIINFNNWINFNVKNKYYIKLIFITTVWAYILNLRITV